LSLNSLRNCTGGDNSEPYAAVAIKHLDADGGGDDAGGGVGGGGVGGGGVGIDLFSPVKSS